MIRQLTLSSALLHLFLVHSAFGFTVVTKVHPHPIHHNWHSSTKTSSSSSTRLWSSYELVRRKQDDKDDNDNVCNNYWRDIEKIQLKTIEGEDTTLGELSVSSSEKPIILSCLSHFGDFNAWELTQQYREALSSGRISKDCSIVLVGIGSAESAQQFAQDLELDEFDKDQITLLADETGAVTDAMGCYKGWLAMDQKHKEKYPQTDINPYLKLLGMIFGFGSPGTIPKVLYGYLGDSQNDKGPEGRKWVVNSLLQGSDMGRFPQLSESAFTGVVDYSPLRSFELATLRLQTGLHIVSNWNKLGPSNGDLFTRMGGTFVFRGGMDKKCIWDFFDQGILCYADMDDICRATQAAVQGQVSYRPPSDEELAELKKERREMIMEEVKRKREEQARMREAEDQRRLLEEARFKEVEEKLEAEEAARLKAEEEQRQKAEEALQNTDEKEEAKKAPRFFLEVKEEGVEEEDKDEYQAVSTDASEFISERETTFESDAVEEPLVVEKTVFNSDQEELVPDDEALDTEESSAEKVEAKSEAVEVPSITVEDDDEDEEESLLITDEDEKAPEDSVSKVVEATVSEETDAELQVEDDSSKQDEEVDSAKKSELFQRELLKARLSMMKPATMKQTVAELQVEGDSSKHEEDTSTKEQVSDEALRFQSSNDSNPDISFNANEVDAARKSELFQRELLKARLSLMKPATMKVVVTNGETVFFPAEEIVEEIQINALSSEDQGTVDAISSDDENVVEPKVLHVRKNGFKAANKKELFQRKLLEARIQVDKASKRK